MGMTLTAEAQNKIEAQLGADIVSNYIWRGQKLGDAAIQPALSLSYQGLTLSALGSIPIMSSGDTKEFDLSIGYQTGAFNVGLTDYWFDTADAQPRYFHYGAHSTAHVWEATIGYDFGPVRADWYTNIGGADGATSDGKRAYSSYMQLTAPFNLGGLQWTACAGAAPYATSFYSRANGFAVTNVALRAQKSITVSSTFSVPAFGQLVWNPSDEKAWMVFGVSL